MKGAAVVVGVVLGAFVGVAGNTVARQHLKPQVDLAAEMVSAEVGATSINLTVLRLLAEGKQQDAVSMLETAVSMNATVLDEWSSLQLGAEDRTQLQKALTAIARHREKHPHQLGVAEADKEVAEILAKYRTD